MSRTVWPWPDIITTIAPRSRTGFFALRVIRASLRPSSIDSGRTNTLGLRATPTSRTRCAGSVTSTNDEINYLVDSACRATRRGPSPVISASWQAGHTVVVKTQPDVIAHCGLRTGLPDVGL